MRAPPSSVRVARLHLADLSLPEWHPEAGADRRAVVFGFVIDHPDGAIVVDTGVGRGSGLIEQLYKPTVADIDDALHSVGIDRRAVAAVVNSHLHFDHCGQNPLFYGVDVPVYVQADEVVAATQPHYSIAEWANVPSRQLRALRGDETIADGVRVVATPGHTKGHQSVAVDTDEGVVVIGAQCVWYMTEFEAEHASAANVDDDDLRAAAIESIRLIKSLEPTVAYFSHDRAVYRRG